MISIQDILRLTCGHIPIKDTAKGHEAADNDGRGRRARDVIGFLQHDTHDG